MGKSKIYFAIFGSGLGHATRILEIAERVRENGDEFRYSCFGQALDYISKSGEKRHVLRCPRLDLEWTADGSFSNMHFILHFPFLFHSFLRQVQFEAQSLSKFSPDVVVSDSRLSPVLIARSKSFPIVTILNQFKASLPPRFGGSKLSRFFERIEGNMLGLLWSLSDRVLMTDLPPPYTIGESNIAGTNVSGIVEYVGFISPSLNLSEERLDKAKRALDIDSKPFVFLQISGPDATKKRFVETVLESANELAQRYNIVISMGYTGGSEEPKKLASGAWLYEWCPIKDELFILSSGVVARSGHRTIGECIDAGKPAVLVPIHNHSEQIGNAEKFRRLGLGLDIRSEFLYPKKLTESIDMCLDDPKYKRNVENLRLVSKRYNGIERTVEIVKSYT